MAAAEQLGLSIRREPLGGEGGGVCILRGQRVLFIDTSADPETRYDRTLAGLATLPDIDNLYLIPEIRQDIEAYRRRPGM